MKDKEEMEKAIKDMKKNINKTYKRSLWTRFEEKLLLIGIIVLLLK